MILQVTLFTDIQLSCCKDNRSTGLLYAICMKETLKVKPLISTIDTVNAVTLLDRASVHLLNTIFPCSQYCRER